MTLTELRYIVALAQENNFSRAAERCSVSQPTLSVAIARLEDELGVQLIDETEKAIGLDYWIVVWLARLCVKQRAKLSRFLG